MRNMSFWLTMDAFRKRTKDVTRRIGWWFLNPRDWVRGVEKCQGIPKGGSVVRMHPIEIVSTRMERLKEITQEDVVREGFPNMTREKFIEEFCKAMKCTPETYVNRIEFVHLGCNHYDGGNCYYPDQCQGATCYSNQLTEDWKECPHVIEEVIE